MKKIIYLLMSLSLVAFASCSDDDKDSPSSENGENGSNSGNGNVSAVSVFKSGTQDGHDYVDLGLTSGTKWATANVGASTPQDYGNYYAWGETSTKSSSTKSYYGWSNYKYGRIYDQLTKYCNSSSYGKDGFTDTKTTLDLSDDAAAANWGGKWRMPTRTQQDELRNECYWVWTESYNNSNVKGYIVYKAKSSIDKGKELNKDETPSSSYKLSDAHIFLPAAGFRYLGGLRSDGSGGLYLSSSLTDEPDYAWDVSFDSFYVYDHRDNWGRCYGYSVRAVIPGE